MIYPLRFVIEKKYPHENTYPIRRYKKRRIVISISVLLMDILPINWS